ncbi:MAG: hypothetical protein CVV27_13865, partial [Candidatus Melainabacteria bacterium HGW-Melainabacteria-1]
TGTKAAATAAKAAAKAVPADPATLPAQDRAPELGKASKALAELSLVDDPTPLGELLDDAMRGLSQGGGNPFGDVDTPPTPFAEREANMHSRLETQLNEKLPAEKGAGYRFSDKELQQQIVKLKKEINSINRMREMGVTDCFGGMTNRKIACESAIRALAQCLEARRQPCP